MKSRGPVLLILVMLVALVAGLTLLLRLRFSSGDVFPP